MTATRPFVDRPVGDVDGATHVAVRLASEWGLPAPELLRAGMNAIYACGDVVLRVGRATAPASSAHELVDVLLAAGVPAPTPIAGAALDIDSYAVTAWERLHPVDVPVGWEAVGEAVATVHRLAPTDLPAAYPLPSPVGFPWWDFEGMLADLSHLLDTESLAGIERAIQAGADWSTELADGAVVCHGDVHPGNVVMTEVGPVLIDFDLMCSATPAWDHAMLTTYASRWGGDAGTYDRFARGYGTSFAADPFTNRLAELRNVAATLMRVKAGQSDESARIEAGRRLRYWRGEPDAPVWRAQ